MDNDFDVRVLSSKIPQFRYQPFRSESRTCCDRQLSLIGHAPQATEPALDESEAAVGPVEQWGANQVLDSLDQLADRSRGDVQLGCRHAKALMPGSCLERTQRIQMT